MKFIKKVLAVFARLILLIAILLIIVFAGLYFFVYYMTNDNHIEYMDYISKYSQEYDLDERLVTSIIKTESDFRADVKSGVGATGLMQLMPDTAKWVADRLGEEYSADMTLDPETNIRYGTYYFRYLINYYQSVDYAILAYNAGFGNVDKWINEGILKGNSSDYDNIPFNETKNYIKKVKNTYRLNKIIYDKYYLDKDSNRWQRSWNTYLELLKNIIP